MAELQHHEHRQTHLHTDSLANGNSLCSPESLGPWAPYPSHFHTPSCARLHSAFSSRRSDPTPPRALLAANRRLDKTKPRDNQSSRGVRRTKSAAGPSCLNMRLAPHPHATLVPRPLPHLTSSTHHHNHRPPLVPWVAHLGPSPYHKVRATLYNYRWPARHLSVA